MTTVLLVRHGLTNLTGPVLAGRTPGVHLDARGLAQAAALADRLRPVTLDAVVVSPLERCRETAGAILEARDAVPPLHVDERLIEVDYGTWTGRAIRELGKDPLWKVVQGHPSAAVFPGGEGLAAMSARVTAAVRDWNERLGPDATYVIVTHADVIKALVADALGLHLDGYQRIGVEPCSLSVVRYDALRTYVLRTNDTGGDVTPLTAQRHPPRRGRRRQASSATSAAPGSSGAPEAASG